MFDKIKELAEKKKLSFNEVEERAGLARNYLYSLKTKTPTTDKLQLIADFFGVSTDYLLGRTEEPYYTLNDKDEKDIQAKMEDILSDLENNALFSREDNSELSEEDRELLIASLENSLRLAKKLAKEKYTPKKYRN
ncbi:helix-turn-helix domain-containing protein [Globicatella sanguinis]